MITVNGQKYDSLNCKYCGAKIFPALAHATHERRHEQSVLRMCPAGHVYQAFELGVEKPCPECRSIKTKRSQSRLGNFGGRPRGNTYAPRNRKTPNKRPPSRVVSLHGAPGSATPDGSDGQSGVIFSEFESLVRELPWLTAAPKVSVK